MFKNCPKCQGFLVQETEQDFYMRLVFQACVMCGKRYEIAAQELNPCREDEMVEA